MNKFNKCRTSEQALEGSHRIAMLQDLVIISVALFDFFLAILYPINKKNAKI